MANKYVVRGNRDDGSLAVGAAGLTEEQIQKGSQILIEGETTPRTVTFLMGKGERLHACCKGTGPFPKGQDVEFTLLG